MVQGGLQAYPGGSAGATKWLSNSFDHGLIGPPWSDLSSAPTPAFASVPLNRTSGSENGRISPANALQTLGVQPGNIGYSGYYFRWAYGLSTDDPSCTPGDWSVATEAYGSSINPQPSGIRVETAAPLSDEQLGFIDGSIGDCPIRGYGYYSGYPELSGGRLVVMPPGAIERAAVSDTGSYGTVTLPSVTLAAPATCYLLTGLSTDDGDNHQNLVSLDGWTLDDEWFSGYIASMKFYHRDFPAGAVPDITVTSLKTGSIQAAAVFVS